jgi:hypothetical protein
MPGWHSFIRKGRGEYKGFLSNNYQIQPPDYRSLINKKRPSYLTFTQQPLNPSMLITFAQQGNPNYALICQKMVLRIT